MKLTVNHKEESITQVKSNGLKLNHIENVDCLVYLKKIKDGYIDLVLTDPPYVISKATGFKAVKNGVQRFAVSMDFGEWDHGVMELEQTIQEFYRVLKNGGTAIIWYDLWKITDIQKMMMKAGFKQLRVIEWIKTNPVPLNSKVNYLTNAREIAVVGIKKSKPVFHSSYDNGIYEYPIYHSNDRIHPTQKPIELMEILIKKHSNEGDVVLDTFMGSGTTAIAAMHTKREYLGCELDKDIFVKMSERVKKYGE
jgi:site-specific DNA-methyltransferase (adenine-specific)